MFQGWVINALGSSGLAGAFVFILVGAVTGLWLALKAKDAELKLLHDARALEREAMAKMIEQDSASSFAMTAATEKKNDVIMTMSNVIVSLTSALDKYEERVELQASMLAEKFSDFRHVVDAFGESNRVISGTLAEVRNMQITMSAELRMMIRGESS
jgi:hypothetical protein